MDIEYEPRAGKFRSNVAELIYDMSIDGGGEELGTSEVFGWYYFALLEDDPLYVYRMGKTRKIVAAILSEDDDGHINVKTFRNIREADKRWEEIKYEYDEFMLGREEYSEEEEE